jgi:hypothetical protein
VKNCCVYEWILGPVLFSKCPQCVWYTGPQQHLCYSIRHTEHTITGGQLYGQQSHLIVYGTIEIIDENRVHTFYLPSAVFNISECSGRYGNYSLPSPFPPPFTTYTLTLTFIYVRGRMVYYIQYRNIYVWDRDRERDRIWERMSITGTVSRDFPAIQRGLWPRHPQRYY